MRAKALFSHDLVQKIKPNMAHSEYSQSALHGAFLWRQVNTVVELKKNFRAREDPRFVNLLGRIRNGITWNGLSPMTAQQAGAGNNYDLSDYAVLMNRRLQVISARNPIDLKRFADAPMIVRFKANQDALNLRAVWSFASKTQQEMCMYHSKDRFRRCALQGEYQKRMWKVRTSVTEDSMGMLPLVPGMRVLVGTPKRRFAPAKVRETMVLLRFFRMSG